MMNAKAFAPGHISGFFEPVYYPQNSERSGSRGAGITISLGATTEISAKPAAKQRIDVCINSKPSQAPVTCLALRYLLGDTPFHLIVNTRLDLPVGQGFGMSAAGALSATSALAHILNCPQEQALKAAHCAEIQLCTGLGDVIASSFGGIEIRREPGLPPWGMIEHILGKYPIVLCVVGKKLETKQVLCDGKKANEVAEYGRYCVKQILEKPSIENFFYLSNWFMKKTGLADKKVLQAVEAANQYGMASMCMLGNSVFAMGDMSSLQKIFSAFGRVFFCSVDSGGVHI